MKIFKITIISILLNVLGQIVVHFYNIESGWIFCIGFIVGMVYVVVSHFIMDK